ncbi:MAG: HAMP domain-containing histidine kinase [Candidatus Dormibacteraeota bacterium]|nr:HAMP domain-containing histidine kinase [Candidatus Dormibacteraeota bacterium]
MSLRRRLLLTLAPLFILGLVGVDIATYLSLQSFLETRLDEQILSVHTAVESVIKNPNSADFGRGARGGVNLTFPPGTFGEIVSPNGTVVAHQDFPGPAADDATASLALPGSLTAQTYITVHGTGSASGNSFRAYVDTVQGDSNGNRLVVALPLDEVGATLSQLLILELVAGAAITIVILAATWLVVRRGMRPLERMGRTARDAATDLSKRVQPSTESTEVGRLGLAINTMLGQLEAAFAERAANEQRLRHFVSDASHELRTPLTSIGGYAELLRRNPDMTETDVLLATRRIEEEARRMGVLVDDLLLLARLDQGRPLEMAPVELAVLVTDAAADARAADPDRTIVEGIEAHVQVIGDDMRLRQVLGNVVRNALVHTPQGTPVEIGLALAGDKAVIEVIDHGPGIAPNHAHRIFERFHRSDPGRSRDQGGSGLGLSIAAAVVSAHGGSIRVDQTRGGGATFRIQLPTVITATSASTGSEGVSQVGPVA